MLKITNGPVINVPVEKKQVKKENVSTDSSFRASVCLCVCACVCVCVCVLYLCIEKT